MSNQSLEAVYEAEEGDRPQSERELEAYRADHRHIPLEDALAVACAHIREHPPAALLALIQEQRDNPYPTYGAYLTPDKAQAVARAWLHEVQEALDMLAEQALVGEMRR